MKNLKVLAVAFVCAFVFGFAAISQAASLDACGQCGISAQGHHHGPHGPRGGWGHGGC